MRSLIRNSRRFGFLAALAALFAVAAPGARAQAPTTFLDYSTLAGDGKTEIAAAVAAYAPVVIGIVVGMVSLAVLIKWLRRAPKAS